MVKKERRFNKHILTNSVIVAISSIGVLVLLVTFGSPSSESTEKLTISTLLGITIFLALTIGLFLFLFYGVKKDKVWGWVIGGILICLGFISIFINMALQPFRLLG